MESVQIHDKTFVPYLKDAEIQEIVKATALKIYEDKHPLVIELVAQPLALVVNIVGPDIIAVGGGLGNSHELIARLDGAVRPRILRQLDRPLVVPAQLTADAGLIGAAALGLAGMAA